MIDSELCCPQCSHHGFVVPARAAHGEEVLGVMCHCCGYLMDQEELTAQLKDRARTVRPNR